MNKPARNWPFASKLKLPLNMVRRIEPSESIIPKSHPQEQGSRKCAMTPLSDAIKLKNAQSFLCPCRSLFIYWTIVGYEIVQKREQARLTTSLEPEFVGFCRIREFCLELGQEQEKCGVGAVESVGGLKN